MKRLMDISGKGLRCTTMDNPKIRIESDGCITEVWIDGEKVERATMADFTFHAEPFEVYCEIELYKTDKDGTPVVENQEIPKEYMVVIDTRM